MMRMRARDLATFCFQSALQVLSTGILSPCSGTETKSTKCDFGVKKIRCVCISFFWKSSRAQLLWTKALVKGGSGITCFQTPQLVFCFPLGCFRLIVIVIVSDIILIVLELPSAV